MTATIENYVCEFFTLKEAKSNTKFCNICNKFLEEKNRKYFVSKFHLFKTGEIVKTDVCDSNVYKCFYPMYLKSIKRLLKTSEKKMRLLWKTLWYCFFIENSNDELHEADDFCRTRSCNLKIQLKF